MASSAASKDFASSLVAEQSEQVRCSPIALETVASKTAAIARKALGLNCKSVSLQKHYLRKSKPQGFTVNNVDLKLVTKLNVDEDQTVSSQSASLQTNEKDSNRTSLGLRLETTRPSSITWSQSSSSSNGSAGYTGDISSYSSYSNAEVLSIPDRKRKRTRPPVMQFIHTHHDVMKSLPARSSLHGQVAALPVTSRPADQHARCNAESSASSQKAHCYLSDVPDNAPMLRQSSVAARLRYLRKASTVSEQQNRDISRCSALTTRDALDDLDDTAASSSGSAPLNINSSEFSVSAGENASLAS